MGLGAGRTECFFSFVFVFCVCGGRGEGDWGALLELVRPVWDGIWLFSKAHHRCFGNCGAAAMALRAACSRILNTSDKPPAFGWRCRPDMPYF